MHNLVEWHTAKELNPAPADLFPHDAGADRADEPPSAIGSRSGGRAPWNRQRSLKGRTPMSAWFVPPIVIPVGLTLVILACAALRALA